MPNSAVWGNVIAAAPPLPDYEVLYVRCRYRDTQSYQGLPILGKTKARALKALDLEIRRGEIFGLLGPNGRATTTTKLLLLALPHQRRGSGLRQRSHRRDQERADRYLPEETYLYRFLNAEETLDFYGRPFDIPGRVASAGAHLIEMVGLGAAKRRQLREYSKGMARRIGLAQALINDPELIILDEPTSGLDPIGTRAIKDLILDLKKQGKTVVMCSHLLADVQDVCDRIGILYQGELKELGRVDSLLTVRDVTEVRASGLSEAAQEEIREVIQRYKGELQYRQPDDHVGRPVPEHHRRKRSPAGPSRAGARRWSMNYNYLLLPNGSGPPRSTG